MVEKSVDVAVEERVEDAGDGGVGGEEGDEEDGGDDLRCSSIEVRVVAAAAVAECLSDLMEVPGIVQLMFQSPRKSRNCLSSIIITDKTNLRFSVSIVFTSSLPKDSFTNRL